MSHTLVCYNNSDCMESVIENAFDLTSANAQVDSIYRIPQDLLMLPQYCQPYLDHSYAMLPTSSNSVNQQQTPIVIDASADQLAAFIDIEDVSCNTTVVTAPMERNASEESNEGADPWEGSVTRCICDFQHDDGYMICCDRCGVWQHVDCMGVDRNNIPESYLCELCLPRLIDKRRAIRLQTIKREQMESEMSGTDSSSDEIFDGRGSGRKKPGRKHFDGQSNTVHKRPVKRRTLGEERPTDKRNHPPTTSNKLTGTRGPRRQSTGESNLRAKRNSAFDVDQNVTIDHSVEDVCLNSYSNGVRSLLANAKDNETAGGKLNALTPTNPSLLKEQINKQRFRLVQFGPDIKAVAANETIRVNQAVAEYTGRVMLAEEFDCGNQLDCFVPFVLRYAFPHGLSVCIDATHSPANDIRYIRCSCMPNAKVVHVLERNLVRFFICSTKNIAEGREVTIPFHFDYQKSEFEVLCACGRPNCQVARFFKQKSSSRPLRVRRSTALSVTGEKSHLATADTLDNGKAMAAAASSSGIRQNNRRSVLGSGLSKMVSPDVGADITLMNALTAISTASTFNCTPDPSPRSAVYPLDARPNGSHSVDTSEDVGTTSSATRSSQMKKEAMKVEKGKVVPGGSRNKGQQPQTTRREMDANRIGMIRSNRLRDRAQQQQQQMANLSSQKE